jgi:hypothetical protein
MNKYIMIQKLFYVIATGRSFMDEYTKGHNSAENVVHNKMSTKYELAE